MQTYTQNQIDNAFRSLPDAIQNAITAVNSANILREITKNYGLHIDEGATLSSETGYVMMGLTHPGEFIQRIKTALNLGDEKARMIAQEINERIFRQVRNELKALHNIEPKSFEKRNSPAQISKPQEPSKNEVATWFSPDTETNLQPEKILEEIENPVPSRPTINDHLENALTNVVKSHNTKIEIKNSGDKPKIDPYREPI